MRKSLEDIPDKHGCTTLYSLGEGLVAADVFRCGNIIVIQLIMGIETRILTIHGKILFNKYFVVGEWEREQQVLDLLDTVIQELKERPLGVNNGCDRASREA